MKTSDLPSNVLSLMEKQEVYQRNSLKTSLRDGLLKSLSSEQASVLSKLMSIFYEANSVIRELLVGLESQPIDFQTEVLVVEMIREENQLMEDIIDFVMDNLTSGSES